jgi:rhomboid protease GluP
VEPSREERIVPPQWLEAAPVTRTLLVLNIAVFVMQVALSEPGAIWNVPTNDALAFGANYPLAVIGEGRWETLVTACFLHGSILHVGFNMLALWQAGPLVERTVGSARMAIMYLVAGAFGNALSTAYGILKFSGAPSLGASGAISGVFAAALVVGWRLQGWRGPLTQAMVRWLAFVVIFGLITNQRGGHVDNAAHIGGAIAGAAIAALWQRGYRYTPRVTKVVLTVCAAVVVGCVAIVGVRDRVDRFATMSLQERFDFTIDALASGHCRDAHDGLRAVERLRATMAPVTSLRAQVEASCGRKP